MWVQNYHIANLGSGGALALSGFRHAARGLLACPDNRQDFIGYFDGRAPFALSALRELSLAIGHQGRRKITLGLPGAVGVTADEVSLTAALSAAQRDATASRDSHLEWLLACPPSNELSQLTDVIGAEFWLAGLTLSEPEIQLFPDPAELQNAYITAQLGHN